MGGRTQLLFDDGNTSGLNVTAIAHEILLILLHNFQWLEVGDVRQPYENGCKERPYHLRADAHQQPRPADVSHHHPG